MFDPRTITILSIICIAGTFVVLLPWFIFIVRASRPSIGFLVLSVLSACLKLLVMVPVLMLMAMGQIQSTFALWALSLPFFVDFYFMYRVARLFKVDARDTRGV